MWSTDESSANCAPVVCSHLVSCACGMRCEFEQSATASMRGIAPCRPVLCSQLRVLLPRADNCHADDCGCCCPVQTSAMHATAAAVAPCRRLKCRRLRVLLPIAYQCNAYHCGRYCLVQTSAMQTTAGAIAPCIPLHSSRLRVLRQRWHTCRVGLANMPLWQAHSTVQWVSSDLDEDLAAQKTKPVLDVAGFAVHFASPTHLFRWPAVLWMVIAPLGNRDHQTC